MNIHEVIVPRWYLASFKKISVQDEIKEIIGETEISFDNIENTPTTLEGYGITDAVNINSVGSAIWKDYTDTINPNGTNLPTEAPANPENTKTYIYYDDVTHKICVREKDGTVYSIQLNT